MRVKINTTYSQNDVLKVLTHVDLMLFGVGEHDATSADEYAQLVMALVEEGRSARGHLVQQDAQGPPVNAKAVSTHVEDLGR